MINKIAGALSNIAKNPGVNNDISSGQVGQDFSSFMKDAAKDSVNTLKEGELMSIKGISGEADLTDVVSAVNSAEATLQLVTTLRDRIIQAYQEIIRMPI
jgi:flagellar hook-basal body complex protein FliE